MATTTNYGWTTPDDTALVKDGAAAIRTLGSSIDTTTKALNPSTTLGDIEYRSSTANTNTRLGIGTTGQILSVVGGVPAWAAAPTSGDNWSLLNAGGTALSANPTTVSGISGKNQLMIIIAGASSTSNADSCYVQFNGTGDYFYVGLAETWASTYAASNFSVENNMASSPGAIFFAKMSNTGGSVLSGAITITGCNASGNKAFQSVGGGNANGSNGQIHYVQQGVYTETATISSVSVKLSNGFATFDAGTVYVYATA